MQLTAQQTTTAIATASLKSDACRQQQNAEFTGTYEHCICLTSTGSISSLLA